MVDQLYKDRKQIYESTKIAQFEAVQEVCRQEESFQAVSVTNLDLTTCLFYIDQIWSFNGDEIKLRDFA